MLPKGKVLVLCGMRVNSVTIRKGQEFWTFLVPNVCLIVLKINSVIFRKE